jgi:hypothetical protein
LKQVEYDDLYNSISANVTHQHTCVIEMVHDEP